MEEQKKEEGTDKKEILFFHGSTNEKRYNEDCRFTLAGIVYPNQISLAISICSKDDQFIKAEGRKRATDRFEKHLNSKGVITIVLTLKKGHERRIFNRFAQMCQFMSKRELIEFFNVCKE